MLIASSDQNKIVPERVVHSQIAPKFGRENSRRRLIVKAVQGTVVNAIPMSKAMAVTAFMNTALVHINY